MRKRTYHGKDDDEDGEGESGEMVRILRGARELLITLAFSPHASGSPLRHRMRA
jgi:hypothetical protein